jgi:hypothetical protein
MTAVSGDPAPLTVVSFRRNVSTPFRVLMNLKRSCLTGLLLLASAGSALAQELIFAPTDSTGRIVGTVTSLQTGAALPAAWVTLLPLKGELHQPTLAAPADSSGRFSFERLQPGGYVLTATAMGTAEAQLLASVPPGGATSIDVALPPIGYDLAERMKQLQQLSEARERWGFKRPIAYRFTLRSECFCFGANRLWVVEEQADTTYVLNSGPGIPTEVPANFAGMERIFAWIEAELRDPTRTVEVRYNRRLGYPERIRFDTLEMITDSWQIITIRNVTEVRQRE